MYTKQTEISRRTAILAVEVQTDDAKRDENLLKLLDNLEKDPRYNEIASKLVKPKDDKNTMRGILSELAALNEKNYLEDRAKAKSNEESIQRTIAIVIVLNMLFYPALVLYFVQNISGRLRLLVSNSERFAKGEELIEAVPADDEIAQLDTVFRDMVALVRNARETEKIQQREFVTMVSHDLRTPLNSVLATLNLITNKNYGELSPEGLERVKAAEAAVERLVRLADDLLDMERLAAGKPLALSEVDLADVVQQSIEDMRGFADFKDISIHSSLNGQLNGMERSSGSEGNASSERLTVRGDKQRLIQVVVNLLSNAIKYSNSDSVVSVSLAKIHDTNIEVRVSDTGPGLDAATIGTIFEPFSSDKSDGSLNGNGVGLSICKAIITQHGGRIGVDAKPNSGCSFWFQLPKGKGP